MLNELWMMGGAARRSRNILSRKICLAPVYFSRRISCYLIKLVIFSEKMKKWRLEAITGNKFLSASEIICPFSRALAVSGEKGLEDYW